MADPPLLALSDIRFHLGDQTIDQAVEERVTAADVPVDRGDGHADPFGEPTHRKRLHPI